MIRRSSLLLACLAAAALAGGCGDDDEQKSSGGSSGPGNVFGGGGDCKDIDAALQKAAREHPGPLKVATDGGEGDVDRITVDICRTSDDNATAVVTVFGMRDDSIRDVRHEIRLIKSGGIWQVTDDQDSRRCQKGHGQQTFGGTSCR